MKHSVILLLLVAAFGARPSAVAAPEIVKVERSMDAMGATWTVAIYSADRFKADSTIDDAFDEVRRLDHLLSNYRPDSEWSKVNREAASGPVKVSEELFNLLSACQEYSRESDGAFDITVGPLMKVWGFYKGTGRFPHRDEIRTAMGRIGWRKVTLDPAARTIRFEVSGMELDPGGIGKGYAVDRMAAILKQHGVTSALISGGTSSIYAIGTPPDEKGWKVSVRDPKDARKTVQDFYLKDESMSTSGNYEKFFMAGGKMYSHIMDPRTGYPSQGMLSVSVIAPRTIDSEAWTKPYYINGRQWATQHQLKQFRVFLCEDKPEQQCALLP
jgi:thiamine biosynthesis lipoprotein